MKKSPFIVAAIVVAASAISLSNPANVSAVQKCEVIKTPKDMEQITATIKTIAEQNAENEEEKQQFLEIANLIPVLFDEKFNNMAEEQIAEEIYNRFITLGAMNNDTPKNEEEVAALKAIANVIAKLFAPTITENCVEVDNYEIIVKVDGVETQRKGLTEIPHEDFINHQSTTIETELAKGNLEYKSAQFDGNTVTLNFKNTTVEKSEEFIETPFTNNEDVVENDTVLDSEFIENDFTSGKEIVEEATVEAEKPTEVAKTTEILAPNTGFEQKDLSLQIVGLFSLLTLITFAALKRK